MSTVDNSASHERFHGEFANTTFEIQRKITETFIEKHFHQLADCYRGLRHFGLYKWTYFNPSSWDQNVDYYNVIGRGLVFPKTIVLENEQLREPVHAVLLVDEILAFGFEMKTNTEYIEGLSDVVQTLKPISNLMEALDPVLKQMLEGLGFYNISGKNLLAKLKRDPAYIRAMIELK